MAFTFIIGYLLGSVPTAVWLGKFMYEIDIREHGSKNAGATNTFRVLGKKAGIWVLIVDILKGGLATMLPVLVQHQFGWIEVNQLMPYRVGAGAFAIIGHVFPLFANFKGGKGVATALGMALFLAPQQAAIVIATFLLVVTLTKYVSVGSMVAAFLFPLLIWWFPGHPDYFLLGFGGTICVLIVVTHKKNIKRLLKGEENKTYLWGKPNANK